MTDASRLPLHPRWRWFRWRAAVLVATVALGLAGFASGVGVSERPDVADAGVAAQLYYTLGLFSVAELVAESMPDAWLGPRSAVAALRPD